MLQNRGSSAESAHTDTEASVSGRCLDSSGKRLEWVKSCAIQVSLLFRNRSSATESAHVNTEASVSGHCLDSSGERMKRVSKNQGIFLSQEENGT